MKRFLWRAEGRLLVFLLGVFGPLAALLAGARLTLWLLSGH